MIDSPMRRSIAGDNRPAPLAEIGQAFGHRQGGASTTPSAKDQGAASGFNFISL
jgi:hypothetical protein